MAIFEILELSEELSEMIAAQNTIESIKKYLIENSFKSLRDAGLEKIRLGITSYEEVNRETFL
jgi:type II secretory ATPase GspE/PulE/Tfp pilus assembly ATPase PilB-like protein